MNTLVAANSPKECKLRTSMSTRVLVWGFKCLCQLTNQNCSAMGLTRVPKSQPASLLATG